MPPQKDKVAGACLSLQGEAPCRGALGAFDLLIRLSVAIPE